MKRGKVLSGIGSPEGVEAAPEGSIYTDISDPQKPVQYNKTSGGDGATGWEETIG